MSAWVHDGNAVYSAAAPVAWATLDLKAKLGGGSTTHPNSRTLALLRVQNTTGVTYIAFRPAGTAIDSYNNGTNAKGAAQCRPDNAASEVNLVMIPTSNVGTVEWQAGVAHNVEISLVGYVESTVADDQVYTGTTPTAWTDLDLTVDTGAAPTGLTGEALVYLWYEKTFGGIKQLSTRPNGATGVWMNYAPVGASNGYPSAVGDSVGLIQKTDSSGIIEHRSESLTLDCDADLSMFEADNWTDLDETVYSAAAPPAAWTFLDLSAHTGAKRALVMLEVHMENVGGALAYLGFRSSDESGNFVPANISYGVGTASIAGLDTDETACVVMETGPTGLISWKSTAVGRDIDITLLGYVVENDPPVVTGTGPVGAAVAPETTITFSCTDDHQVDSTTIALSLTLPGAALGTPVIVAGVFQAPYTGTITVHGTGYDVVVDPIPMIVGTWQADASCDDSHGETGTDNWSWTVVAAAATTTALHPTGPVLQLDEIRFSVRDLYGLDLSTLVIQAIPAVGPTVVIYTGSSWQTGWSGIVSGSDAIYGTNPRRLDVLIQGWPDSFEASSPMVWRFQADITSIVGVPI